MFGRNFVSLYFLPGKLLIAQVTANKKKLRKYATIELPGELIKGYKIQDPGALAKILKNTWSKFSLGEKVVGIVLPEFSTFTKFFKMPSLSLSELDEAVRWQAQEYLPKSSDMVMDWKIVKKDKDNLETLIIAVEKEILSGYVEACEKAGLFPLVVETPSICLVRAVKEEDKGALIAYLGAEDSTLVLSEGQKIIGTSVIRSGGLEEVERTASKMLTHYKQVKAERVLMGGFAGDESLITKMGERLGISVERIKLDIGGAEEKVIQEYLIPIFMQLQDPAEPADPSTLNLLPEGLVNKYKTAKSRVQTWSLTLTITLFVWVSFLVTLVAYLFMTQQINDIKAQNQSRSEISRQREMVVKDVAMINETSQKVSKIHEIYIFPQTVLNQVDRARPEGVNIQMYDLDLDKGEVVLSGTAANRQALIAFKQSLEGFEEIASVNVPISSFEAEANLEFRMTFGYQKVIPEEGI